LQQHQLKDKVAATERLEPIQRRFYGSIYITLIEISAVIAVVTIVVINMIINSFLIPSLFFFRPS